MTFLWMFFRRSLRGNVDRNLARRAAAAGRLTVVPYVGTWIEIISSIPGKLKEWGRSLRGNVDRNLVMLKLGPIIVSASFPTWERG